MYMGELGQTRLRAFLSAGIWILAGVGFVLIFFTRGGPGTFAADSGRHLAGAVDVGLAFMAYWLALWLTRQRRGAPPVVDERDAQIVARANQATLIIVLVGVFVFTIGLWVAYEPSGTVPVGWMWFLAYGSVILASAASPLVTLLLDRRMSGHG